MDKNNYRKTEYNTPFIEQRADPYMYRHMDGMYYFTASVPAYDRIVLRRADTITELQTAEEKTLWVKHENGPQSIHVWAPEIHYVDGGWYIYYAAGDKDNVWEIRPYVLHCKGEDPMEDAWEELGMMRAADENADLLDPRSWTKLRHPILKTDREKGIFGPGHNSFVKSENGKTDLCIYHARPYDEIVGDPLYDPNRHAMIMEICYDENEFPVFSYQKIADIFEK